MKMEGGRMVEREGGRENRESMRKEKEGRREGRGKEMRGVEVWERKEKE